METTTSADAQVSGSPAEGLYSWIGDLSALEPHGQFSRWIQDHDVLVYRWEGKIKAISNICPHFGGPIGFHKMQKGEFTCLWHNYRFSADTGACKNNPHLSLREYSVKVIDQGIWVRLVETE